MRQRERGFIISTELLLLAVILIIGLIVGWATLRDAVTAELVDTANAVESGITLYYFQDPDRGAGPAYTPQTFTFDTPVLEGF